MTVMKLTIFVVIFLSLYINLTLSAPMKFSKTPFRKEVTNGDLQLKRISVQTSIPGNLGKYFTHINCTTCKVISELVVIGRFSEQNKNTGKRKTDLGKKPKSESDKDGSKVKDDDYYEEVEKDQVEEDDNYGEVEKDSDRELPSPKPKSESNKDSDNIKDYDYSDAEQGDNSVEVLKDNDSKEVKKYDDREVSSSKTKYSSYKKPHNASTKHEVEDVKFQGEGSTTENSECEKLGAKENTSGSKTDPRKKLICENNKDDENVKNNNFDVTEGDNFQKVERNDGYEAEDDDGASSNVKIENDKDEKEDDDISKIIISVDEIRNDKSSNRKIENQMNAEEREKNSQNRETEKERLKKILQVCDGSVCIRQTITESIPNR